MPRRKACGATQSTPDPVFTDTLELDLSTRRAVARGPAPAAGPRGAVGRRRRRSNRSCPRISWAKPAARKPVGRSKGANYELKDGDVVIAAITSCTNTSNPSVMLAAGLLAQERGRARASRSSPGSRPRSRRAARWSPTITAAPACRPISTRSASTSSGYGCTTCIGNSGPLPEPDRRGDRGGRPRRRRGALRQPQFRGPHQSASAGQLSRLAAAGRRLRARRLDERSTSPPTPLGERQRRQAGLSQATSGLEQRDRRRSLPRCRRARCSASATATCSRARRSGSSVKVGRAASPIAGRTRIDLCRNPPYFEGMTEGAGGRVTDIVGRAAPGAPRRLHHHRPHLARRLHQERQPGRRIPDRAIRCAPLDFNSYGARRGNHEVMMRGTFANIRIRNEMVPGVEGGMTKHLPTAS